MLADLRELSVQRPRGRKGPAECSEGDVAGPVSKEEAGDRVPVSVEGAWERLGLVSAQWEPRAGPVSAQEDRSPGGGTSLQPHSTLPRGLREAG